MVLVSNTSCTTSCWKKSQRHHMWGHNLCHSFDVEVDSKARTSEAVYGSPGCACCCYILSEPSAKEPIKTASFRLSLLGTPLSKENNFYTPSTPRKVVHKLDRNHRRTCQDLFLQSAQETKTPFTGFINAKVTFFQPNKESSQQFICQLGAKKRFFTTKRF